MRPRGKEYREFPPSWHTLRCAGPDKCQHVPLLLRLPSPSTPASASVSLCMFLKCQPCLCRLFCTLLSLLFAAVCLCLWVRVCGSRERFFLLSPVAVDCNELFRRRTSKDSVFLSDPFYLASVYLATRFLSSLLFVLLSAAAEYRHRTPHE